MAPVESIFRIIFSAEPAFMRLEPATTSGPTSATISTCATFPRRELRLQVTATVLAPRARANSTAAMGKGGGPLAAIPTTTSFLAGLFLGLFFRPRFGGASLGSVGMGKGLGPPALYKC